MVRRALDEGYDVRCLVRPRPAPADFLRDWGAIVVNVSLKLDQVDYSTLLLVMTSEDQRVNSNKFVPLSLSS